MPLNLKTFHAKDKETVVKTIYKCIYCSEIDVNKDFGDEHIIPKNLGGQFVLKNGCCKKCETDISKANYERTVLQGIWNPIRVLAGIRRRRKNENVNDNVPLRIYHGNSSKIINVSAREFGSPLVFIKFPFPGYLRQAERKNEIDIIGDELFILPSFESFEEKVKEKYHTTKFHLMQQYDPMAYGRLLAKIGYGFAVYSLGLDAIKEAYVLPVILDKSDEVGYWVGGSDEEIIIDEYAHTLCELELKKNPHNGKTEILVRIKIFASLRCCTYLVVVGELN